jgi:hypothetical protein
VSLEHFDLLSVSLELFFVSLELLFVSLELLFVSLELLFVSLDLLFVSLEIFFVSLDLLFVSPELLCISRTNPVFTITVEIRVVLRSTVSRPVCPGIRPLSGTCDQFFFLFHENYLQIFAFVFSMERPL